MGHFCYPAKRIGIIGGGQIGKMMTQEAKKMGFYVKILDPTPNSPAAQVADEQIVGEFYDREKVEELVTSSDVTTFDIERACEYLNDLSKEGHLIYPSPQILETIQDKIKQKDLLARSSIPIPRYEEVTTEGIERAVERFGYPVVQKASRDGYDGRGVFVIKEKNDIKDAIASSSLLEEFVDFEKELAINVAKSTKGEIKCHPVVEMVFDERANICDMVIAPARISEEVRDRTQEIGIRTIEALGEGAIGSFGVEMFLTKDGEVLVNEIAPRPHNSGHYTIEACMTSQFEQHIRAIMGLPLGETELLSPAVMVNLLGEEGYEGPPLIEGLEEALSIQGLSFHLYGKGLMRPFRKMGHVTILDEDVEGAIEKAKRLKGLLKVKSGGKV
jgi:5-(carboxyamino)imidazole ribonucleotide synthase